MAKTIVTGAFGALGRAMAAQLKSAGHEVAAVDIAPVPDDWDGHAFGGVDLADEAAVTKAFADAADALGGLDGLVNIAGGFAWETVGDGSLDTFDSMYRMNLRTVAAACRAAMNHMESGAAIVNVGAAAAGSTPVAEGMASYAASKAGVMALTESLAEELRGRGIRVNAVLPTILDTPTNRKDMPDEDFSGWVKPESAARVIAFLLSPDAHAVTGSGVRLSVGG